MRYDARPQCRGLVLSSAACQAPNTDVIAAGCVHAETKKKKSRKKKRRTKDDGPGDRQPVALRPERLGGAFTSPVTPVRCGRPSVRSSKLFFPRPLRGQSFVAAPCGIGCGLWGAAQGRAFLGVEGRNRKCV